MVRSSRSNKLFRLCLAALFLLPLLAHAELAPPTTVLYQTSDVLTERITANGLAEFIRQVQAKLVLADFAQAEGDYAVVIAVHPSGRIRGWACMKSGGHLKEAQEAVDSLARSIDAPSVTNGSIVFALSYSTTTDSAESPWVPVPAEWTSIIESSGKPMQMDSIMEEIFAGINR